jgi:hypothetical protein
VGLFAVLLDTLFIPAGPDAPPIIVGATTVVAVALLVAAVVRKS